MTRGVLLFAAAMMAVPAAANACSMMPGYKVPTNLELAAKADVIVLATIDGERSAEKPWEGVVLAKPTMLLKGQALPKRVELTGAGLSNSADAVVESDPNELRRPNPGALIGGCVRYTFRPGMQLVLFLTRNTDGSLVPFRSSFSRDAEDVPGPDALWVKAVREYATISVLPKNEWKDRLRERSVELRAAGDPASSAIARDMDIERAGNRLRSFD
jgi:hypothetical protein